MIGRDDRLYLLAGNYLSVLDREGAHVMEVALSAAARCFTVAGDGTVFVGQRDHLEVFDVKGLPLATWPALTGKVWLTSLAAGAAAVFASDATGKVVLRFDREGTVQGRIGRKDPQTKAPGFIVPSPYFDLELDAEGRLWVVNPGRHQIECYNEPGELQSAWGEASFALSGFCGCCNPAYFTRLADGRFVTSEKGLPRVKVYSAQGVFESVVTGPGDFPRYFENLNSSPQGMDVTADSRGRVYVADALEGVVRVYQPKPA